MVSSSIVYIISAPASPLLGFLVDRMGRNILWVMLAVITTLLSHMMLAFTFWNPWIAMVTAKLSTNRLWEPVLQGGVTMHNISYRFKSCVFSNGPSCHCVSVSVRFVVFSAGLCSLAHGGVCGAGASAGNRVRIVSLIWQCLLMLLCMCWSSNNALMCCTVCSPYRTWV